MSRYNNQPVIKIVATLGGLAVLFRLLNRAFFTGKNRPIQTLAAGEGIWLTMLGFAADVLAIPAVLRNKKDSSRTALTSLSPAGIPAFDQLALQQNLDLREHYKQLSDQLLRITIASFVLVFLDRSLRTKAGKLFLLYAFTHAVTYTFYTFSPLGPAFRNKYRPVVYYTVLPEAVRAAGNNKNSFYSGHTSSAATATFFLAKIFSDRFPQPCIAARSFFYLLAACPPLTVGYFRVKALKHFPSDVLVALALGAVFGVSIPARFPVND